MTRITESMIRKRAEHNMGEIFSLEELTLHQQDIEKIELLNNACRELKILYFQNNLIQRIENVNKLKKLEYLNLALNNVTRIENLEGNESLNKLDMTVNFVAELTSIESLKGNYNLRELFFTGNPCTQYDGYRSFVIGTLPQLQWLDGTEINKSERILAMQELEDGLRDRIIVQQNAEMCTDRSADSSDKTVPCTSTAKIVEVDDDTLEPITDYLDDDDDDDDDLKVVSAPSGDPSNEKNYWDEKTKFTPQSRIEAHAKLAENREKGFESKPSGPQPIKRERVLERDGRILQMNEGKWDFSLKLNDLDHRLVLDVACYRHLDTSLIDVDVQPEYICIKIKGKVLQLVLPERVHPDTSSAKRSAVTGHLLITMPLVREKIVVKAASQKSGAKGKVLEDKNRNNCKENIREMLEVGDECNSGHVDIYNIVSNSKKVAKSGKIIKSKISDDEDPFVDDLSVPPLI